MVDYIRDLRPLKWGRALKLHGGNSEPLMSALGQKQTSRRARAMSALPPIADIGTQSRNVRFVPKADKVQRNKIALYSITSSAIESSPDGTSMSSSRAV
jgi:hypothetical protein